MGPERTHRNSRKPTETTPKHYAKTNRTRRIPTKLIKTFSMTYTKYYSTTNGTCENQRNRQDHNSWKPNQPTGTHRIQLNPHQTNTRKQKESTGPTQFPIAGAPGFGSAMAVWPLIDSLIIYLTHFWLNIIIITYQHHFWWRISLSETNNSCSTTNIIPSSYLTTFLKNIINYGEEPITWSNNRALDRHRRSELYSIPW